jgi:hypothetical protein
MKSIVFIMKFCLILVFHVIYKMYFSLAHNIISASIMAPFQFEYIKIEYFDSVAFYDIYK